MFVQPAFEQFDARREVEPRRPQQVDVVEIDAAVEAVGEVVVRVDVGEHFVAAWAEEAESAVAEFRGRPVAAEGGDGEGHRQVVAESTQEFGGDHANALNSPRGRFPFANGVA